MSMLTNASNKVSSDSAGISWDNEIGQHVHKRRGVQHTEVFGGDTDQEPTQRSSKAVGSFVAVSSVCMRTCWPDTSLM
jgi:hypothetical protein